MLPVQLLDEFEAIHVEPLGGNSQPRIEPIMEEFDEPEGAQVAFDGYRT